MSRKTLLAILAVIGAVLVFVGKEFGLALDASAVMAGITAILLYIFFEMKADFRRVSSQAGKFKDPKFILALIASVLAAVNTNFGLGIPVEAVIAVLALIMGVLFKAQTV